VAYRERHASLYGGATAVRSKHDVRNIEEIRMDVGVSLEHVEPGGENLAVAQSSSESFLVNDRSREVFTRTAVGFIIEKAVADQMTRVRRERDVR
jgi:hypothetical protein